MKDFRLHFPTNMQTHGSFLPNNPKHNSLTGESLTKQK